MHLDRAPAPAACCFRTSGEILIDRLHDTQRAFDAVAPVYDSLVDANEVLSRFRDATRAAVLDHVPADQTLLDLGCGSGLDAEFFAARGYRVTAIDWSPEMMRQTVARLDRAGLLDRARVVNLGIHEIGDFAPRSFDAAYSDLGPLNCVPDLPSIAQMLSRILRSGGILVASVMGKYSPWEVITYAIKGDWERARLRWTDAAVPVPLHEGTVWTRYYSPRRFRKTFERASFKRVSLRALGLFLPPPYGRPIARTHPRLFRTLAAAERIVGRWPGSCQLGDHFLIVLRRR
ncbi:MAG: class I SAM-dependent methyltransferase [Acidobacteria bacterium]|nr:class I SAM-dependent methyltransferase [Acidobacteriota bacterium]